MSNRSLARRPKSDPQSPPAVTAVAPPPDPAAALAEKERARERAVIDHSYSLLASLYRHLLEPVVGTDERLEGSSTPYVIDLVKRFAPRDPVEEMLLSQMVQTHLRLTNLTVKAHQQKHLAWAKLMHEAADRAANTFRRQMLALAEYRSPKPPPRHVTRIAQANIANQQVVHNAARPTGGAGNATNEQGSTGTDTHGAGRRPTAPAALWPIAGGPGGAAVVGGAGEAVDGEHRSADGIWEGRGEPQLPAARAAVRKGRRGGTGEP
jgi:hypothetical protein